MKELNKIVIKRKNSNAKQKLKEQTVFQLQICFKPERKLSDTDKYVFILIY